MEGVGCGGLPVYSGSQLQKQGQMLHSHPIIIIIIIIIIPPSTLFFFFTGAGVPLMLVLSYLVAGSAPEVCVLPASHVVCPSLLSWSCASFCTAAGVE